MSPPPCALVFHKAYYKSAIRILAHLKTHLKDNEFYLDSIEIGNLEPDGMFLWQFQIKTEEGVAHTWSRDPAPLDYDPAIAREEIIFIVKAGITAGCVS